MHLQRDKSVFDVTSLPLDKYAAALGLPGAPKVKFVREAQAAKKKAAKAALVAAGEKASSSAKADAAEESEEEGATGKVRTKYDRMFERRNQGVLSEHYSKLIDHDAKRSEASSSSDEDGSSDSAAEDELIGGNGDDGAGSDDDEADFITLKRADHALSDDEGAEPSASAHLSKRALAMGTSKKAMALAGKRGQGEKITFDDAGLPHALYELQDELAFRAGGDAKSLAQRYVEEEGARLKEQDQLDKERVRERKRERKRILKEREREERGEEKKGAASATLAPLEDDDGYETPDFVFPGEESGEEEDDDDEDEQEEEEATPPPAKKRKSAAAATTIEDDEALALRLLGA